MMTAEILPLDAFVRTIGASRLTPHALFLGAGASITSGMPSAQMCIWEWKRSIFLTNNIGLEPQFSEISLVSVQSRIQQWLDRQGIYPDLGAAEEYSVFIEACYPIPESRRAYFQDKVRHAKPYIGYRLLGALAARGLIRSVWTTNFDQLTSRAAVDNGITPIEVGIDCQERIVRAQNTGELLTVSLHGDYRYDSLKNTDIELQRQEHRLQESLIRQFTDTPVVVCGYSGRDASVMKAFNAAFASKGAGALYWCVHDTNRVPVAVRDLVSRARAQGRTAYIVSTHGFDDLMVRLSLHCLDSTDQQRIGQLIAENAGGDTRARMPFQVEGHHPTAVLKSNAFEIECPSEAICFELHEWPQLQVWHWVRSKTAGKNVVAVPFKGQIVSLGAVDDLRACFGDNIKGRPQRSPLFGGHLRYDDGAITCMFREALVRSIVHGTRFQTDGNREIWAPDTAREEPFQGVVYTVYESVCLSLRQINRSSFLVLKPSLKILTASGDPPSLEVGRDLKQRILGYQHNKEFNDAVNYWRAAFFDGPAQKKPYEYPPSCASSFVFSVRKAPVFVEILGSKTMPAISVRLSLKPFLKQAGFEIAEPQLMFAGRTGKGMARDAHPVRGIVNNRPFDFPLTQQQLSPDIRIGIICPKPEEKNLRSYLQAASRNIIPQKGEADYLPAYPGFGKAFGVNLEIPEPDATGWMVCPEPIGSDDRSRTLEAARNINRCIDVLQSSYSPSVVLIFFPTRWRTLRGFSNELERFDVHDFVKASSVQRGVATQFLDENTLADSMQCRVWWWLSLAFYVKAMRTPWVLEGLDRDSAFVGLGMSIDRTREPGKHVVMGCSHIYSSRGEGMQYRLSQVENPVFYGKNPFLSRDDARRTGEQIRELFFEARSALPKRVVIHKRTRFTHDERLGLTEGLSGVDQVEMLEISADESLRYIASSVDSHGGLREDNYPVRRGSVVRLDDYSALMWVHGVTSAVSNSRRYYQGKRRIPAPLLLKRHCGQSELRQLAEEILGLSKMNWNTFDLYTKFPATIQSCNEIARIGSLIQAFHPKAYDFRLFI
jgi:hypothetical protein